VWLLADDLGYGDLGCYGGAIATPRLDALARSGVLFTQAYALAPSCSPSRAGLLTGRPPQCAGFEFNPGSVSESSELVRGLEPGQPGVARTLREQGYATACIGKWHLGSLPGSHPLDQGFDEFFGFLGPSHNYTPGMDEGGDPLLSGREPVVEKDYLTDALAREALRFIARNEDRPFFLYLAFNAVHRPFQAPVRLRGRFPELEGDEWKRACMLTALDEAVGRVLDALRERGLERDTLVVFTSDNGAPPLSGHNGALRLGKHMLFEGGLRVPMLAAWAGHLSAGARVDVPVSHLDLGATALRLAGADEGALQGFDGLDLFGPGEDFAARSLLWRVGPSAALRRGDLKLVASRDSRWLFDVVADPGEEHDLSGDQPGLTERLGRELAERLPALPAPAWSGRGQAKPEQVLGRPYWVLQ